MKYKQVKFLNKFNKLKIHKMYSEKSTVNSTRYVNYVVNLFHCTEYEIESIKKHCENNNLRFKQSSIYYSPYLYYIRFSV